MIKAPETNKPQVFNLHGLRGTSDRTVDMHVALYERPNFFNMRMRSKLTRIRSRNASFNSVESRIPNTAVLTGVTTVSIVPPDPLYLSKS